MWTLRPLSFLTFWLLALTSTVMAVATYEGLVDDRVLRVPDFREDTWGTYDLSVETVGGPTYRIPGYYEVALRTLAQRGSFLEWTVREAAHALPHQGPDERMLATTRTTTWQPDGPVVSLSETSDSWSPGGVNGREATVTRTYPMPLVPGPLDGFVDGETLVQAHGGSSWVVVAMGRAVPEWRLVEADLAGSVLGRPVLGLDLGEKVHVGTSDLRPCPLVALDTALDRPWVGPAEQARRTQAVHQVWYDGTSALPTRIECLGELFDHQGASLGAVRAAADLVGEDRTGSRSGVRSASDARAPPSAPTTAVAPGSMFFSLEDADASVRADPDLQGFQTFLRTGTDVRLACAKRTVDHIQEPVGAPTGPIDALFPTSSQGALGWGPRWNLHYLDAEGAWFQVASTLQVGPGGDPRGPPTNGEVGRFACNPAPLWSDIPATPIVSSDLVLAWFEKHAGTPFQDLAPGWELHLSSSATSALVGPQGPKVAIPGSPSMTYSVRHLDLGKLAPGAEGVGRAEQRGAFSVWDAETGRLLVEGEESYRDVAATPADPPSPLTASAETAARPLAPFLLWGMIGASMLYLALTFWNAIQQVATDACLSLWSKLSRPAVVENGRRGELVALVAATPGILLGELKAASGLPWGVLSHHVGILERHGVLVSVRVGRDRGFFLDGQMEASRRPAAVLVRRQRPRDVWRSVAAVPGITQRELSARLAMSHPTVHFHVKGLVAVGLLRKEREGRKVRYYAEAAPQPQRT